ncbi:Phosphatidylinositol 3 [Scedosporium apiospermum]|uniref:1-phosphatidylinositol 4-kinase n=1 Tax=Pseudallescheria apiosperma TaxID=563466 RepID=A0A084G2I7_PSEDA|nr:Phosphatidylinositol 3 [Scedosporium apiospermum]KEZ41549.1 Phosphatidylinositol 3 [Scedosporium apiospermum]
MPTFPSFETLIFVGQTFWIFQTYLHDLSAHPQTESFQTCARVYNKVQHIVFGLSDTARHEKIRDNILPVTVLSSFVLASIAVPILPHWAGPLAVAQARKPQPSVDLIAETRPESAKPTRSQTVTVGTSRSKRNREGPRSVSGGGGGQEASSPTRSSRKVPPAIITRPPPASVPKKPPKTSVESKIKPQFEMLSLDARLSSSSLPLPDTRTSKTITRPTTPISAGLVAQANNVLLSRRHSHHIKARRSASDLTRVQKTRLLRQHYFRSETQFLTALEAISNRLVIVPKLARLSALRAELALIAQDLPAEVDIPVICPPTLVNGSPSKSRHHRIVRLNPAEATVLNSAEKVPYLLMVEVLRDDFNFDPDTGDNERLITTLLSEQGPKRRLFDLSDAPRVHSNSNLNPRQSEPIIDSVFEPTSGDLGSSPLIKTPEDELPPKSPNSYLPYHVVHKSATYTSSSDLALAPMTAENSISRSSSPGGRSRRRMTLQPRANASLDQPDFSALATHMRTAAQMLSQLEATSGKRPKYEVEAIRSKIIASMQSLEEQSFDLDDGHGPTFDTIMAKASTQSAAAANPDLDEDSGLDQALEASAGVARMENDFKTGGLQRKGDRDDPSAAVFGEAWQAKKERIRATSPYGWMKNWDLVSVIVKTGADLRQEAFACQLINVCHKIWVDAGVDVWVKLMKILVTGESSGLIETITNGVSLHSIRRSLTLASIESGQNPRRKMATLKDHFLKAFGPEGSDAYKAGVDAFKRSLAAYSIISYVLQLKDRHNGNVLIDSEGHIIHIDFGFMLSNSPGSVGFEAAPFKLTYEYVEVLGGESSADFEDFKKLCKQAFQALRRSADNIIDLVAMMGQESKMPCFSSNVVTATNSLRQRFQLQLSADAAEQFVENDLIGKSLGSYYTRLYDTFQYRTQGIY